MLNYSNGTDKHVTRNDRLSVYEGNRQACPVECRRALYRVRTELIFRSRIDWQHNIVQNMTIEVVSLVAEDWHLGASLVQQFQVNFGDANIGRVGTSGDNCSQ